MMLNPSASCSDMDLKEDSWWPIDTSSFRSLGDIPENSRWIYRQQQKVLCLKITGHLKTYYLQLKWLPLLSLLDIVQQTHLWMAINSSQLHHNQAVIFIDNLRKDFISELLSVSRGIQPPSEDWIPMSFHRWGCRFVQCIPHDPYNRRKHVRILQEAYETINVLNYGEYMFYLLGMLGLGSSTIQIF
jgi:hypothetical protein